ncbi:MAG TPA: TlpA disulfide reductase family protein [Bryobacteraceae bacterium]|jgi:cytochrome c biogenesis protein CcmG/thiol:disulfide interchange protein DsbE
MNSKLIVLSFALAGAAFAADAPALTVGNPVPAFKLKDSGGKTVKLSNYRGKVVLLDFWATWCTGCKQEMPWFVNFQKKYGAKKFAVVGVAMDEDGWKTLRPFLKQHSEFRYKMLAGDQATADQYGSADSLPDTFLIDKKGNLAGAYRGVVDRDAVESAIEALLGK